MKNSESTEFFSCSIISHFYTHSCVYGFKQIEYLPFSFKHLVGNSLYWVKNGEVIEQSLKEKNG